MEVAYLISRESNNETGKVYVNCFIVGEITEGNIFKEYQKFKHMHRVLKDWCLAGDGDIYSVKEIENDEIELGDIDFDEKDKKQLKSMYRGMDIWEQINQIKGDHIYDPSKGYNMRFEDAPLVICPKCGGVTYEELVGEDGCNRCKNEE